MRIYLLRHATAEPRAPEGGDSPTRRLVAKGKRQCRDVGALLARMRLWFDLVVSSPYARALQTAEGSLRSAGLRSPIQREPRLAPDATVDEAVEALCDHRGLTRVLAVGHEPLLSLVAARLVGAPSAAIVLKKAGIVELDLIEHRPPRASLLGVLRPAHLRDLAS